MRARIILSAFQFKFNLRQTLSTPKFIPQIHNVNMTYVNFVSDEISGWDLPVLAIGSNQTCPGKLTKHRVAQAANWAGAIWKGG